MSKGVSVTQVSRLPLEIFLEEKLQHLWFAVERLQRYFCPISDLLKYWEPILTLCVLKTIHAETSIVTCRPTGHIFWNKNIIKIRSQYSGKKSEGYKISKPWIKSAQDRIRSSQSHMLGKSVHDLVSIPGWIFFSWWLYGIIRSRTLIL